MSKLATVPALLSLLLLGAHFVHAGSLLLALGSLAICALVFSRDRRIIWIVQGILALGALEWVFRTYEIVQERQVEHREWLRAALILLVVAGFTAASATLLRP